MSLTSSPADRSIVAALSCVLYPSHHERQGTFQNVSAISSSVGRLKRCLRERKMKEMEVRHSPFRYSNCAIDSFNLLR